MGREKLSTLVATIKNFPFPPSDNEIKKPIVRARLGSFRKIITFVDSEKYRKYKTQLEIYRVQENIKFKELQELLNKLLEEDSNLKLSIEIYLNVHNETLYSKKKTLKKWDASNRIKALLDGFAKITNLDDKHYFKVQIEKRVTDNPFENCEFVIYKL